MIGMILGLTIVVVVMAILFKLEGRISRVDRAEGEALRQIEEDVVSAAIIEKWRKENDPGP